MTSPAARILASCLLPLVPCLATEFAVHPDILSGSSVYIESIVGNMDGLLAEQIIKRGVPLVLTRDRNSANYIIGSLNSFSLASSPIPADKQSFDGAIAMIDPQTHRVVWMGDAGRSNRSKKPRKIAAQLISKLQKDLFDSRSIADRIDKILHP